MRRITIALLATAALVAGCGKKQGLAVAPGKALPVAAATAPRQLGPDELLQTTAQQRPTRFNELVTRSQDLRSDRFDMPPPG